MPIIKTITAILREYPDLYQVNYQHHAKRKLGTSEEDDGWEYKQLTYPIITNN